MTTRVETVSPDTRLRLIGRALQTTAVLALTKDPNVVPQDQVPRISSPLAVVSYQIQPSEDRSGLGSDHMTVRERVGVDLWIDAAATIEIVGNITKDANRHLAMLRRAVDDAMRADNLNASLLLLDPPVAETQFVEVVAELIDTWSAIALPSTEDTKRLTADYELTFFDVQ